MNKLLLAAAIALSLVSCKTLEGVKSDVASFIYDAKPIELEDFCALKARDPATAREQYVNKPYKWAGYLGGIEKNGNEYKVSMTVDKGHKVFAKVNDVQGFKKGQFAHVVGYISEANFQPKFRTQCFLLMERGHLEQPTR